MQAPPPPQQPPYGGPQQPPRRPQIFAPISSLAELKDQSEGRILRYGEEIRGRRRVLQKLQNECGNLANAAHHAMQDPQMTPEQRARAAADVDMLGKWYTIVGQALEINKQYLEDIVQTEFVLQGIAQRWVAGMPPDPSLLETLTGPQLPQPPQPSQQQQVVPEPQPNLQEQHYTQTRDAYAAPLPTTQTAPHRVVPMPRAPVIMPPQRQPQQSQDQPSEEPASKTNANSEPRTAS
jgi:hypothetical protein